MKQTNLRALVIIPFLLTHPASLFAQAGSSPDSVICRTNRTLVQRGGELTLVTVPLSLSASIKVSTNCTFKVNEGKERALEPGQTLRSDGFLLNPDGSILPAADHISMTKGVVMVFKDGVGQPLTTSLTLPDGSIINPDGSYTRPSGRSARLRDGQLIAPDGASLAGLDTITLRGGKVIIYKSGAILSLDSGNQIMGMFDGSKVRGDGFLISSDGTTTPLTEGQTITVEGVRADW